MRSNFHLKFYESLQKDFRKIRELYNGNFNQEGLDAVLYHMSNARRTITAIAHSSREVTVLVYCIDTLTALVDEGDRAKIVAFAKVLDKIPSAFAGKNDLRLCHGGVLAFRERYGEAYFPEWEMHYPYFETDRIEMAKIVALRILHASYLFLPILVPVGILLLDYTPIPFLLTVLLFTPLIVLSITLAKRETDKEPIGYERVGMFGKIWNEYERNRLGGAFHRPDCESYSDVAELNTIEIRFEWRGHHFYIDIDENGVFILMDEESADPTELHLTYGQLSCLEDFYRTVNQKIDQFVTVSPT